MRDERLSPPMLVALVGSMAITGWLGWRHIGPFRWLAEAQASLFAGHYYPFLTWLLLFLGLAIPSMAVARAIPIGQDVDLSRWSAYFRMYPRHLQAVVLAVMGIFGGGFLFVRSSLMGSQVEISLAAFVAAETPPGWVHLTRFELDVLDIVEVSRDRIYVPLLEAGEEGPPGVFLKISRDELDVLDVADGVDGVVHEDDLPNEVRVVYEDAGFIAERYWVLDVGQTPDFDRNFGLFGLIAGTIVGALAFGYWLRVIRGTI